MRVLEDLSPQLKVTEPIDIGNSNIDFELILGTSSEETLDIECNLTDED